MKLGFVFNTAFIEYQNRYYSVNLTKEVWEQRYLKYFDEIVVVAYVKHSKDDPEGKYARSDTEKVSFCCIEDNDSIKKAFNTNSFIKKSIRECDAVICRSWWGTKACRQLNKPYMIEVITNIWDSLWYHSFKGKAVALPHFFLQRYSIKKAPFVLYVSQQFLQDKYPTNGQSCGCPDVWLEEPNEEVLEKRLTKINQAKNDSVTLGMIGSNAVGYRGHDTLLKAVKGLAQAGIDCRVKFLGGGNPEKWIKYAQQIGVEERTEFCGTLPHGEAVMEWIDNIDILVMPTRAEALGRAVIEAMSRGCPVLGTIETGIREQVGADCLFHIDDYKAIARKVIHMIQDKYYMESCAKENFYRSFKYTNRETNVVRDGFYEAFTEYAMKKKAE